MTTPPLPADAAALLADAVSAAVLGCPDVVALSSGRLGEVATYLPGRRIAGVRVGDDGAVTVHVVARYGPTVQEIAKQVRAAVAGVAGPGPVTVGVDDLVLPTPDVVVVALDQDATVVEAVVAGAPGTTGSGTVVLVDDPLADPLADALVAEALAGPDLLLDDVETGRTVPIVPVVPPVVVDPPAGQPPRR